MLASGKGVDLEIPRDVAHFSWRTRVLLSTIVRQGVHRVGTRQLKTRILWVHSYKIASNNTGQRLCQIHFSGRSIWGLQEQHILEFAAVNHE
jgi:hypothetical protein